MDKHERRWTPSRMVVAAAIAVGVAVGSYGVASAASGSGSSSSTPSAAAQSGRQPWGPQRSDETTLTGDTAAKVRALALARVPGGTVVRVETDVDGNAAYEAHMVRSDGTPVTVYVSKDLKVVSVQSGMPRPPRQPSGASA